MRQEVEQGILNIKSKRQEVEDRINRIMADISLMDNTLSKMHQSISSLELEKSSLYQKQVELETALKVIYKVENNIDLESEDVISIPEPVIEEDNLGDENHSDEHKENTFENSELGVGEGIIEEV